MKNHLAYDNWNWFASLSATPWMNQRKRFCKIHWKNTILYLEKKTDRFFLIYEHDQKAGSLKFKQRTITNNTFILLDALCVGITFKVREHIKWKKSPIRWPKWWSFFCGSAAGRHLPSSNGKIFNLRIFSPICFSTRSFIVLSNNDSKKKFFAVWITGKHKYFAYFRIPINSSSL